MLDKWIGDYVKNVSKKKDVSFSEGIRLGLALYHLKKIQEDHPGCKFATDIDELADKIMDCTGSPQCEEEKARAISKIYFEARKAMECAIEAHEKGA